MYRNTLHCIVAGQGAGCWAGRAGAQAERAGRTGGTSRARRRRGKGAQAARQGRAGHDAATRLAGRLGRACARWLGQIRALCTRSNFDPVFGLSTVPESLFGTLFINPVH